MLHPLSIRVAESILSEMGIDPRKTVRCSLDLSSSPVATLVVTLAVLPDDLERVLQGLKAIPAKAAVVEAPCNPNLEQSVSDLLGEVKAIRETVDLWRNLGALVTTAGL